MEILCAYEQTHVMPAVPTEPLFAYWKLCYHFVWMLLMKEYIIESSIVYLDHQAVLVHINFQDL
jgi:hypothetical protein